MNEETLGMENMLLINFGQKPGVKNCTTAENYDVEVVIIHKLGSIFGLDLKLDI